MDKEILEAIHGLIFTCGPQSFAQVYHEVKAQCPDIGGLEDTYPDVNHVVSIVKEHLNHLVSIGSIIRQYHEKFGIVYAYSSLNQQEGFT